jgi:CheY-like chemotaxis protein
MTEVHKTILVADDDATVRLMVAQILESRGYDVIEAVDGLDAIRLTRALRPDMVVCDITMPRMDGYLVIRALGRHPQTRSIPFIFLTALSKAHHIRKGLSVGADDYLTKPFRAAELLHAVALRFAKHEAAICEAQQKLDALRRSVTLAFPHELRTPLHVIQGFAALLLEEGEALGAENVEMVAIINHHAERLNRLAERFLIYAAAEYAPDRSESAPSPEVTRDAGNVVTQVVLAAATQANREADLNLEIADGGAAIGEQNLLWIVSELIDNALKFSEPGMQVYITSFNRSGRYIISVEDEGRGLTTEQLAGVGAYIQFDRIRHEQQGVGLGLTIAKRLIERSGGRMELRSAPGAGTTAVVSLYADLNARTSAQSGPTLTETAGQALK